MVADGAVKTELAAIYNLDCESPYMKPPQGESPKCHYFLLLGCLH